LSYVVENAIRVVVSVILLLNGYGIVMLFLAVAVTRFMGMFLLTGFYIKILGRPSLQLRSDILWVLAKQSPTFTSIAVFSTIHLSMDSIMLSKLQTIEAVGIYSAADRLLTICKTLPTAFASALLPFFTKELLQGKSRLQGLTQTSLRYTFILLFPIVAGTVIVADQIIPLIYGSKFVSAGPVLQLHIVSLIPFSMVYILAQVLIATDNQKIDLSLNILAAIVNFILNFILIPMYAEIGAVLATLSSILIFNQIQYWYVERYLFKLGFIAGAYKAIAASAGMAAATYFLRDFNLFLNIFVSALVYVILLIVLGAVSKSELQLLKQIFLKKSGEPTP
jgi:O-antigen/teichoic acid export membrane protein